MVPAALILAAVAMLTTQSALAHERRAVGKYTLLVGFNDEPALQGQPNGIQVTVTVPSEANRPVEGLADTLKASVASGGGQPKEFPLRAQFGAPGRYVADFIPTRPGTYIFNFSGSIEGNPVNERFESGPGRFNDVEAVDQLQFPEAVPPANDVARAARAADDRAAAAEEAAASARSLAIAGVAVGVVGIVVGAIALGLLVGRRPAEAATETRRA
jgi:hypothetical protein